jgi:hypothetical protein
MDEVPIEHDRHVGVELGQGDVPGVKGVRPPKQAGDLLCHALQDAIPSNRIRSPRA